MKWEVGPNNWWDVGLSDRWGGIGGRWSLNIGGRLASVIGGVELVGGGLST